MFKHFSSVNAEILELFCFFVEKIYYYSFKEEAMSYALKIVSRKMLNIFSDLKYYGILYLTKLNRNEKYISISESSISSRSSKSRKLTSWENIHKFLMKFQHKMKQPQSLWERNWLGWKVFQELFNILPILLLLKVVPRNKQGSNLQIWN